MLLYLPYFVRERFRQSLKTLLFGQRDNMVDGVAQWLGRRSLTGRLSLIYAWSTVACDHCVSMVSAMGQPTRTAQPSISLGSVN